MSTFLRKHGLKIGIGLVVIFIAIQFVGLVVPAFARTNPEVTTQIQWDSPRTEALARTACMDCHSNESQWPWYAYIAPVSWLVTNDVNEGRDYLNFSTGRGELEAEEMAKVINAGEMPPAIYTLMHGDANLTDAEKQELIAGLQATFR